MDFERRITLLAQIHQAFSPSAPIDSKDLFAGRLRQIDKLMGAIFQRGAHAIIFGERGVGKTSIANLLYDMLVLGGQSGYQRARINCSDSMGFDMIWASVFRQLATTIDGEQIYLHDSVPVGATSENIRELLDSLDGPSLIIIDEFDRVSDSSTKILMADTIKTLSDNSTKATIILVGVADSIQELIAEHRSIDRSLIQVEMQRMSKAELIEIIDKGLARCQELAISPEVKMRIGDYSQGLPSYTHLLAREACLQAVQTDRLSVTMDDLGLAVKEAADTQLETNLSSYRLSVTAPRGKNFKPVLLACALAAKDDHGFFYARDVVQPLGLIMGKQYGIPAFAKHLKLFCEDSRGPILQRKGKPYRFVRPIMEPYVILRGIADGIITEAQLSRPSLDSNVPEQLSLISPSVAQLSEF
ncbi:MAG TPA: ATP-binding protein [Bryobacteraceae bacterium]|jgi:Cdc6-like AAA superfamily ATPase|nr:ATP-binding protein [Bryobacteraceae bacterium]